MMNTQTYLLHTTWENRNLPGLPTRRERLCRIDRKTLRTAVRRFEYTCGGFGGRDVIEIEVRHGQIAARKYSPGYGSFEKKRTLSKRAWERFLSKLFDEYRLHEWAPYYNKPAVMDGTQWSVTVTLGTGEQVRSGGSNAWPSAFFAFKSALNALVDPNAAVLDSEQMRLSTTDTRQYEDVAGAVRPAAPQSGYRYLELTEDPDAFLMALE